MLIADVDTRGARPANESEADESASMTDFFLWRLSGVGVRCDAFTKVHTSSATSDAASGKRPGFRKVELRAAGSRARGGGRRAAQR